MDGAWAHAGKPASIPASARRSIFATTGQSLRGPADQRVRDPLTHWLHSERASTPSRPALISDDLRHADARRRHAGRHRDREGRSLVKSGVGPVAVRADGHRIPTRAIAADQMGR